MTGPYAFSAAPVEAESPHVIEAILSGDLEKGIPISSLFLLFMIIGGNFLAPLFPCRLQNILETNMYVKHILGFLTLLFFVEIAGGSFYGHIDQAFITSCMLYFWFILTTAMEAKLFMILVILFAIMYLTKMYISRIDKQATPESIALTKKVVKIEGIFYYLSLAITILGVVKYYRRKSSELGDKFNFITFFLGKYKCD